MVGKQKREMKKKREDFGQKFSRRFRDELHVPHCIWSDVLFDMICMCYDWKPVNKIPLTKMLEDLDAGKFEWNPEQFRIKFKDTVILSSREETLRYCRNSMHDALGIIRAGFGEKTAEGSIIAGFHLSSAILHDVQRKLDSIQL